MPQDRDWTTYGYDSYLSRSIQPFDPNYRSAEQFSYTLESGSIGTSLVSEINVSKLTAGSITSQAITLAVKDGGGDVKIQAGKTDFVNTDSGFILGLDDSDSNKAKFFIGDTTVYMNWTGTALTIVGANVTISGADGLTVNSGGNILLNAGGDLYLTDDVSNPSEIRFRKASDTTKYWTINKSPTTNKEYLMIYPIGLSSGAVLYLGADETGVGYQASESYVFGSNYVYLVTGAAASEYFRIYSSGGIAYAEIDGTNGGQLNVDNIYGFTKCKYRQGGTTGDNSWTTQGTSNTDTSAKNIIIQCGSQITANTTGGPTYGWYTSAALTVTFPTAYSQIPLVFLTPYSDHGIVQLIWTSISKTSFQVRGLCPASVAAGVAFTWQAIGQ